MEAIVFIGIQASGKSTFYKNNFFKTHVRLNLDMLKTRKKEDVLLEACIHARISFVIDNTNPTVADRKKYIDIAKAAGYKVIGYYFESGIDEALYRNDRREGKECIPVAGIMGTYSKMQVPVKDEGYDLLYRISIGENGSFIEEEM